MKIKNSIELASTPERKVALKIAEKGLEAIDTHLVLEKSVQLHGDTLSVLNQNFKLSDEGKLIVICIGKCATDAAVSFEKILGDRLDKGVALGVGKSSSLRKIKYYEGSHPMPSEANVIGSKAIIDQITNLQAEDTVLFLISGGGSTLLAQPPSSGGGTSVEKAALQELFHSGATIQEINTVRKHMSFARGGFLAKHAYPARVISIIFSDVPGNELGFIASGPTVLDTTTIEDAESVIKKYHLNLQRENLTETPKDKMYFERVHNILALSSETAMTAMKLEARANGYNVLIKNSRFAGEAREIGVAIAKEISTAEPGTVYLYCGESTVTFKEHGRGGRNQELALASVPYLSGTTLVLSLASDGKDNGPHAGVLVDSKIRDQARANNLDPSFFLERNESSEFFEKVGGLVETGYTGSNVSDLVIAISGMSIINKSDNNNYIIENNTMDKKFTLRMEEVGIGDVGEVGGKNASLGEMIKSLTPKGVRVPSGFIVTASAYRHFLKETKMDEFISKTLEGLDTHDLDDLAARGEKIRKAIEKADMPQDLQESIFKGYEVMEEKYGKDVDVACRSSATAEDLPGASFAGEHETYLGVRGKEHVVLAVKWAMASLFNDRAISYRHDKGFDHFAVALSVGIQKMVRSDKSCSGIMFTLDTESGFRDIVVISGSWGLGELIVQGEVTPDEFIVFKKTLDSSPDALISKKLGVKNRKMIYGSATGLKATKIIPTSGKESSSFVITDQEARELAKWGVIIEEHYSAKNGGKWTPMDTEWAKDGDTGELFIVQARPETIHAGRDFNKLKEYILKEQGTLLTKGASVGSKIATGTAHVIMNVKGIHEFKAGEVLVTDMTDPDWEPIMKIASAIVTDKGGRTSHAAIVSRELGIPAIVGCENATKKISNGQVVTVDTSGSEGMIYDGALKFEVVEHDVQSIPKPKTHIMVNIATPETAWEKSFLPNMGVGLAREEFIIAGTIGVHPLALLNFDSLDEKTKSKIDKKTIGWEDRVQFYVDNLAYGIAKIGAAFHPNPVIVRFSDFKTNEYRTLLGGELYEPQEENPMIGWRGASRYYDPKFAEAFKLECKAMKKVRDDMGLTNVIPMVPFCRTPEEGQKTKDIMKQCGLDCKTYVMCEIPSNILLADEFLNIFDGMSIGSNDLTQLVLGLDRDSGIVSHVANELNPAVRKMVKEIIGICKSKNKYIGICGQAPSDHPEFAKFLVEEGIESMSLNPDTVIKTIIAVAETEKSLGK